MLGLVVVVVELVVVLLDVVGHVQLGNDQIGPLPPMSMIWATSDASAFAAKTSLCPVPRVRQRFTVAHELKHVLDASHEDAIYRHLPAGPDRRRHIEAVCDHFAACLLMPRAQVKRLWGEGIQDFSVLATYFDVSQPGHAHSAAGHRLGRATASLHPDSLGCGSSRRPWESITGQPGEEAVRGVRRQLPARELPAVQHRELITRGADPCRLRERKEGHDEGQTQCGGPGSGRRRPLGQPCWQASGAVPTGEYHASGHPGRRIRGLLHSGPAGRLHAQGPRTGCRGDRRVRRRRSVGPFGRPTRAAGHAAAPPNLG